MVGQIGMKRAASAAVLLVFAIACSGGTPTARSTPPATTSSPTKTEKERAQAIVLKSADFPTGWSGTAHTDDPASKEFERRIQACSGISPSASTTDVFGNDFDLNQASVGSEAQFFTSAAIARADVDSVNNNRIFNCVRSVLVDELKAALAEQGVQGAKLSGVSLVRTAVPRYGDGSAGIRLTGTVTVANQSLRFFQQVWVARKGRVEAVASFFNIGAAFPSALQRSLFETMAARLVADGGA